MNKIKLIALVISLSSCATSPPQPERLSQEDARALHAQNIEVSTLEPFNFALLDPPKGLLGALGGASMEAAGNKFVSQNNIEDPSRLIAKTIGDHLIQKYDLKEQPVSKSLNPGVKLTVKTGFWAFGQTLSSKGKWNLLYWPKIIVSDSKSGKILASYNCVKKREEGVQSGLNYDEMTKENAKNIKLHLGEMASECINEFKTLVL